MKRPRPRLFRWLAAGAGVALVLALGLYLARLRLARVAVDTFLRMAGASDVSLSVRQASPWRVVLDDLAFRVRARPFAARRVTLERARWWMPSLGSVRVEQASWTVPIDGSDSNPWSWTTYEGGAPRVRPTALPAEEFSIDGTLVVRAAALPDQALALRLEARVNERREWTGTLGAEGPGVRAAARGVFRPGAGELEFTVPALRVELKAWDDFLQRLLVLPGGRWDLDGVVTAEVTGRYADGVLAANGAVRLREGRIENAERRITARGVEFDAVMDDFDRVISQPGTFRAAEVSAGALRGRQLEAKFSLAGPDRIALEEVRVEVLGGVLRTGPFNLFADQRELELLLLADGLQVEEILALAREVPARATGRVNGRLPLLLNPAGLRFGTGWLELAPGTPAELQLNAAGLLTRGADPNSRSYPVLQRVEAGLLRLRLSQLRLDIYPPDRPPGRSAVLRLAGEPVDPTVRAPVTLDLNVNGPLEKLIDLGLDPRVSLGTRP